MQLLKLAIIAIATLALNYPAFAEQGMTEQQSYILRQVLAVDGKITKEMHDQFWDQAPKDSNDVMRKMIVFLLSEVKLSQAYSRAGWQSALISFQRKQVVRSKELDEDQAKIVSFVHDSAPFEKDSADYEAFVSAFENQSKISFQNTDRLLSAAATGQAMDVGGGRMMKIDDSLIHTVLDGMDSSFERLNLLINPDWQD